LLVALACSFLDAVVPPLGIPLAVLAIWLILRREGKGWSALGFRRPRSWPRTILTATAVALAWQAIAVLGLLLAKQAAGAEGPDISRFESIDGNPLMLAQWLTVAWTTAGFGEEIIWRGFLMTRVAGLLGEGRRAWITSLVLTSTVFGLLHLYQGLSGVFMTGISGLLLGSLFLLSGRNLWLPIITHGMLNTMSFLAIYFGLVRYLESF
jgi:membrane protease YdiL (CAAX protease family)